MLGWAGTIHGDLDLSPLLYAAQARPRWTFLPSGPPGAQPAPHRLAQLPNVHFLPPLPLMEVPGAPVPVPGAAELPPGGAAGLRRDPHPDL